MSEQGQILGAAAPAKSEYFDLQVLRAVAALGVICDHAAIVTSVGHTKPELAEYALMFLGFFGVFIFFVISGFIMANSTQGGERSLSSVWKFFVKRIVRIAPLYFIFTAAKWVLSRGDASIADILKSLLFIPYYNEAEVIRPVLGQGWTLNYEMFFYLVFGISLFLPRLWSLVGTFAVLIGFVLSGLVMGRGNHLAAPWNVYTDPILLLFLGGVLLSALQIRVNERGAVRARWIYPGLYCLAVGVFLIEVVGGYTGNVLFPIMTGVLAVAVVGVATLCPTGARSQFDRAMHFLGSASYSIYLSHTFVVELLKKIALQAVGPIAYVVLCLLVAAGVGCVVYLVIEKPIVSGLGRWVRQRMP